MSLLPHLFHGTLDNEPLSACLKAYESYPDKIGFKDRKMRLFNNFRSRQSVISSVNYIFRKMMSKTIGELNYNDEEALNLGAVFEEISDENSFVGGPTEINIIDTAESLQAMAERPDGEAADSLGANTVYAQESQIGENSGTESQEEDEQPSKIQLEARFVANSIKKLMLPDEKGNVFKVYDKNIKQYRKVEYKDIVILLRATKNWADIFSEELGNAGNPVFADTGTGYFNSIEIKTVLSLLQIKDNPLQDIPLLAVLRSPIAEFSGEELIDVRLYDTEGTFETVR